MGTGFFLALLAGFIWSCGNVLHKLLASKLIRSPFFMLLIFSSVAGIFGIILFALEPVMMRGYDLLLAIAAGVLYFGAAFLYLYAMKTEEASRVVPLFSIGTVLIVLFSGLFLGEVFSVRQYTGIFLVILGSAVISIESHIFSFLKSRLLGIMVAAGILFAFNALLVKVLLRTHSFMQVFSHVSFVEGIAGAMLAFMLLPALRRTLRRISVRHVVLNACAEAASIGGELIYTIALSLWYLALVETVASLQYAFIFLWGIALSKYRPQVLSERVSGRLMLQKGAAILLIIAGIYLIA
ncbi:MAG: EamA family transporter [Patescibacteria group bacterium]